MMTHQQKIVRKISDVVRIWPLVVVLSLLWGYPTLAADSPQDLPVVQTPQILWKVQSPKNTIFLAGSIHILQKHHYPLHQVFDEAFDQSARVIFEVDLDGSSSPLAQMTMLRKGLYLNGESLPTVLSPEIYATAKEHFAGLGQHIEDFHRMKPWMAATAVMALELQKLGFESAYGVDRHYFERAKAAGKAIQGLETVEFQLNLFDELPLSIQKQFLLQTLKDLKNLEKQVSEMVRAWKQGNIQELETLLLSMSEYPELNQALVINRNNDWLPYIEQALHEKEPVFIVVGTLHLLGKDGLVAMLKDKGYRIQQL
ncbi:MAG: TraB/GumN family protein [Nitrospirota bacterium]|nr:MAG: TraB/GumN family protein [Nitrospirota bacterium]